MKWTLGILTVLLVEVYAAPGSHRDSKTSASTNMSQEVNSGPITIEPTTQNLFGDVVAITPPNAESIELQHLNDDTRFYPDYGDEDHIDGQHFTEVPPTRTKRESIDYKDLNYEMYLDSSYSRRRRDSGPEPFRIDLDIPGDFDTQSTDSSDVPTPQSPISDPDSISTQITYVIISEDDSPEDEYEEKDTGRLDNGRGEHDNKVIDLVVPSSEQETTNSDSSDSFVGRNRVLGAIANTIRSNSRSNGRSQSSIVDTAPSTSDNRLLTRKRRQSPYHQLPDFLNYRVGRSVSESDTDDTEPDDAYGPNSKGLSMGRMKRSERVTPLPEFAYEFSELTRPSSTYVNGRLRNYYVPERRKSKRSSEDSTEKSDIAGSTTGTDLDVVTATYPLGIDATKENLSLPEGNFLGPRIYAKGDLIQEEQPTITGIAAPMERETSVPVSNGAEADTVYSASVNSIPVIIPVVAPTSHPGEEPRIEVSVPSGYVPYIIQLEPRKNQTSGDTDASQVPRNATPNDEAISDIVTTSKPEVPTLVPYVPTIIIAPSTPKSGYEVLTQTEVPSGVVEPRSSETIAAQGSESSSTPATATLELPSNLSQEETKSRSKQKRAGWKDISSAPVGEGEQPKQQTAAWESASTLPTVVEVQSRTATWKSASSAPTGEEVIPQQRTASWESVPVGEAELPKQHTAQWEPISNAPERETESSTRETGNTAESAESSIQFTEDIQHSATSTPVGLPSSQPSTDVPLSPMNFDSEMSDQALPTRRGKHRLGKGNQVVPILEKNYFMSSNGSFGYSYKTGNGIQVEESGYLKKEPGQKGSLADGVAQTVQGSYSYPAPDGRTIRVRYVADENGFRPQVEDLPK